MALKAPTRPDIPPLVSDADYAALSAQDGVLRRALESREAEMEIMTALAYLERGGASPSNRQRIMERVQELRRKVGVPADSDRPLPEKLSVVDNDPVIERGLKIAMGEIVPPEESRQAKMPRLRSEIDAIIAARKKLAIRLDERRSELSSAIAERLLPQHRTILRSRLDAALALAATVDAEYALISAMHMAGYEHQPGVLTSPPLDPARRLGSATEWDSAVNMFRRALATLKVI